MIEIVQVLNSVGHKLHVIITPHILQRLLLELDVILVCIRVSLSDVSNFAIEMFAVTGHPCHDDGRPLWNMHKCERKLGASLMAK